MAGSSYAGTVRHVVRQCKRALPRGCGHRSWPACQKHSTTAWLERQREKRLPVDDFMVTLWSRSHRRLDLHPHVHVVVPGGGIDAAHRQWRKVKGRYLFNAFALARVFRAKLLRGSYGDVILSTL